MRDGIEGTELKERNTYMPQGGGEVKINRLRKELSENFPVFTKKSIKIRSKGFRGIIQIFFVDLNSFLANMKIF